jgi:hypothetical protein
MQLFVKRIWIHLLLLLTYFLFVQVLFSLVKKEFSFKTKYVLLVVFFPYKNIYFSNFRIYFYGIFKYKLPTVLPWLFLTKGFTVMSRFFL